MGIDGSPENDLKVYLAWDSDRTDVDLWVTTPAGEKVFYGNRAGAGGEALFGDVTTGYGPESFTASHAKPGVYTVQVQFFSSGSAFKEARGDVTIILGEGRQGESQHVLPYRLFNAGDKTTIARIHVGASQ